MLADVRMPARLSDTSFEVRARLALEENFASMWSQFGRGPGCTLHDKDGALWFETPIPVPPYNMVIRFPSGRGATIDAIFAQFKKRAVPFVWFVHPGDAPGLRDELASRGFENAEEVTGMASDLGDLPAMPSVPPGIELHEVTPEHDFQPFMECVMARWKVPEGSRATLLAIAQGNRIGAPGSPNRAWVALKNGEAVAKAFTHDHDGSVGLYGMATRPEARNLGLGRLVLIAALTNARRRGHRLAVLHATPMARPLYASVGFRELSTIHLFAAPHSFYA